ncbi:MAG: sigma-70 family RNA polymerase sigma factor [bacterium]
MPKERFRPERESELVFEEFVRKYQRRLYALAFRYIGNPDRAEELSQEAFLKAFKALAKFRGESQLYTWLYRITINLCIDERRRHRPLEIPIDDLPLASGFDPDRREQTMMLQEALAQLPPALRTCLVMHDLEGYSYQEIANVCRTPLGTIMSRMNTARKRLRQIIEQHYPDLKPERLR